PAKLDPLLQQFGSLRPENSKLKTENSAAGGGVIRDVRADQPLPWGDAPPDHLTPLLLRVVNANFRIGTPESAERLAALAARTDLPERIRTEALHGLATWATPAPRDRIVGVYRPLPARDATPAREALQRALPGLLALQSPPPLTPNQQAALDRAKAADPDFEPLDTRFTTATPAPVLVAIIEAVRRLSPPDSHALLFRLVASQASTAARVAALTALADGVTAGFTVPTRFTSKDGRLTVENPGGDPEAGRSLWQLGVALQLAAQATDEPLRLEASRIQALLNPEDAAGALATQLRSDSIPGQQAAYASLGTLKSAAADALLAEALDRLMKREVANEVLLDLVLAAGQRESAAVKSRLAAYQEWKLPKDHLSPHRETLFGGDAERGRKLFYENAAVACTRCHQIG
ncbi:MAG: hypothetical protein J0L84_20820, partial [Verrucomicrobia bacterium]|nr:hypothetical protein [Verrucomicrobiota bacterium]